jgi:hypothetical protein
VAGQEVRLYPLVGQAQLSADGQRLLTVKASDLREQYEEIEVMGRLLDRGLAKLSGIGFGDGIHAVAFSPDGRWLASSGPEHAVRLWDVQTGKALSGHAVHKLSAAQGVYLKGQGIVYTATVPTHFQKAVGGADSPATKQLTEWERVRRELRGEKVESEKDKPRDDTSIADAVLRVLADNGKNLGRLPEGENVTVALTLVQTQACVNCHRAADPGALRHTLGSAGGGAAPPGSSGPGSAGPSAGGGAPAGGPGIGSGGGRPPGTGGGPPSGPGVGAGAGASPDGAGERAEFRKHALMGDLAMKQQDYNQAVEAYRKAIAGYRPQTSDSAARLELIEVATKMARSLIAQGKTQEAENIVKSIIKMTDQLATTQQGDKPAQDKPAMPLPGKLIITVPKKVLDQAGTGKMSFDEFRKAATVDHFTFDKPATEKPKGGTGEQ